MLSDSLSNALGLADVDDGTTTKEKVNTCIIGCVKRGAVIKWAEVLLNAESIVIQYPSFRN